MSPDHDDWLHRALAPARALEPTDDELDAVVAAAIAARTRRRRRRAALGGRTVAVALPALLVAAAAAAATGLLPVGAVIDGVGFRGDKREVVRETVAATATSEGVGAWRITSFATGQGASCMKLTLLDSAAERGPGPRVSGYCGHVAAFSEFGHGRRAAAVARGEAVLFGTAPAAARTVELVSGRQRVATPAHPGPDAERRYWVLAAPARWSNPSVVWLDRHGRRGGTLDVAHRFGRPSAPTVVATGATPATGPWRLIAYESRRLSNRGDVYSPEGLPCLSLDLVAPPGGVPKRSGSCGVQPRTPGFTRAQTPSVRGLGAREGEMLMYGRAPEHADAVEVRAGGRTISTHTRPSPPGVPGRFWLIARPARDFANGHVYWVDRDSGERGPRVEVLPP